TTRLASISVQGAVQQKQNEWDCKQEHGFVCAFRWRVFVRYGGWPWLFFVGHDCLHGAEGNTARHQDMVVCWSRETIAAQEQRGGRSDRDRGWLRLEMPGMVVRLRSEWEQPRGAT